jgi:formylglycine-generating enzyme required for sulfatase activity
MRSVLLRIFLLTFLLAPSASAEVTIEWVTVGDPGNACDTQTQGCFGRVDEPYRIGKYEVTNAQYVEFLNAVAKTDPFELWVTFLGGARGGIERNGSSGSYTYTLIVGREEWPVISGFYRAMRFVNWLANGQPTGAQGPGTTEDGAYELLGGTKTPSNGATVLRNPDATIFIPTEDEWFKAAYYDRNSMTYNTYPFADGFDGVLCQDAPGTTSHSANCNRTGSLPTGVGGYTDSASPYGTLDQGGNAFEWNETIVGTQRVYRGGSWGLTSDLTAAASRSIDSGGFLSNNIGFRVASPVPPVPSIAPLGIALLGGLLGLAGWRRLRA